MTKKESEPIWIARELARCSGCRKCEIECSLAHEGRVWPEASRIRVFMLVPGVEFPHLCAQCEDYPCVEACPYEALSISKKTGAVLVDAKLCKACGKCITACPGRVPHMHPSEKRVVICDLCGGDPKCVKVCSEARYNVLRVVERGNSLFKLYSRRPEEISRDLCVRLYGDKAEEFR